MLNPAHTIVAIGSYGYDWNGDDVDSLSVRGSRRSPRTTPARRSFSTTPPTTRTSPTCEDDDTKHDVWFLDGVTAYNEIHAADPYQPAGYALWRLGSEDPSVWTVLGRPYGAPAPHALRDIPIIEDIDYRRRRAKSCASMRRSHAGQRARSNSIRKPATSTTRPTPSFPPAM